MLNLICHQQAQRCIVSNALLAKEGHCIDLGTGIVLGAQKFDMLDAGEIIGWLNSDDIYDPGAG